VPRALEADGASPSAAEIIARNNDRSRRRAALDAADAATEAHNPETLSLPKRAPRDPPARARRLAGAGHREAG